MNRYQKVATDPANWLPEKDRRWYVAKYIEIKREYGIEMDRTKTTAVLKVYESCWSFEMAKPECN